MAISKFKQILTIAVMVGCSQTALAASTFLPDWVDHFGVCSSSGMDFSDISDQNKLFTNCVLKGFNRTSCDDGLTPADFCQDTYKYSQNDYVRPVLAFK